MLQLRSMSGEGGRRGRGTRARAVHFVSSAAVVGVVALLASASSLPAQAHHRPGHGQGPSPSPGQSTPPPAEKTATDLTATGYHTVEVYRHCIVTCLHDRVDMVGFVRTRTGGVGVAGLTVTVTTKGPFDEEEAVTALTDANGRFVLENFDQGEPTTWHASTAGDASHEGSEASGQFLLGVQVVTG